MGFLFRPNDFISHIHSVNTVKEIGMKVPCNYLSHRVWHSQHRPSFVPRSSIRGDFCICGCGTMGSCTCWSSSGKPLSSIFSLPHPVTEKFTIAYSVTLVESMENPVFLPPAPRRMGKVIVSVCGQSTLERGTPSPSHNTSTGPMSFPGVPHVHPIILQLVPCPFRG